MRETTSGDAVVVADPADGEAEPRRISSNARLRRRSPDDLLQHVAAGRALHREVVQLIGGGLDPDLVQAEPLGLLAQPHAAIVVAADRSGSWCPQPEHRAVVDHAAGLVAHRGVDHLPVGELADVAGARGLQQLLGVGPEHLELPQRREVHDGGLLAAGPVFLLRRRGC